MITSYDTKGDMIRVSVNNSSRVFVYPKEKFNTRAALLREINRSINAENIRTNKKNNRFNRVKDEIDTQLGGRP